MQLKKRWTNWFGTAFGTAFGTDESDRGSASLEFITAGVILLVPLIYLVLAVANIHAAALAVEGSARHAARVYATAQSLAQAQERVELAVAVSLDDFGYDLEDAEITVQCAPDPDTCLARETRIDITVTVSANLPLVPDAVDLGRASVPVSGHASTHISRVRATS